MPKIIDYFRYNRISFKIIELFLANLLGVPPSMWPEYRTNGTIGHMYDGGRRIARTAGLILKIKNQKNKIRRPIILLD